MRADVIDLVAVRSDDLYLDVIGAGGNITDVPERMRDELTEVLIGCRDEVRDTS
jgi:hypothetical protein